MCSNHIIQVLEERRRMMKHIKKRIIAVLSVMLMFIGSMSNSITAFATTPTHYSQGQTSDYNATDWYEDTKWAKVGSVALGRTLSLKDITTYGKNVTDVYDRNQGIGSFATPQRNDWRKLGFRSTSVRNIVAGFGKTPESGDHYSYWANDPDFSYKPTAWLNHFYDDALADDNTRLAYQRKIQVHYGQTINLVAATDDTVTTGGTSLTGNGQFYWSVIELNELGEILFDSSWLKTNQTWTVGIDTGGLGTPYGVSPDDRRLQVKYVIPVMRWDNGDISMGSGSLKISASKINNSFDIFYMVGSYFTYTFNSNGGNLATYTRSRTGLSGLNAAIAEPTRAGYRFAGWKVSGGGKQNGQVYTTAALQSMFNSGDYWSTLFGDATFTAQWELPYTYNVYYKSSTDGRILHDSSTVTGFSGTSTTLSAPSVTGYNTPSNQTVSFDTSSKDIIFYYTPITYSISYNLDEGDVSGNPTSYTIESGSITLKNPVKAGGWEFIGWSGTGLSGDNNLSVVIPTGSTGDRSYTAHWKRLEFTLNFDKTYPSLNNGNTIKLDYTSKKVIYGQSIGELPEATLNGWTFNGWKKADGTLISSTTPYWQLSDDTVYASWTDNAPEEINIKSTNNISKTQTITLTGKDYGSGIVEYYFGTEEHSDSFTSFPLQSDGSISVEVEIKKEGTYWFIIKDRSGNESRKSITLYRTIFNSNEDYIWGRKDTYSSIPKFTKETLNGYSINPSGEKINPSAERSGCVLKGWNKSASTCDENVINDVIYVTGNQTYYAIWKDTINPLVVITDVSNNDANSQIITFNLYDLDKNYTSGDFEGKDLEYIKAHGEKTGSDIAAYWFGTNPIYNGDGNSRTSVDIVKDEGYSVNLERTVGEANYYYIFAEDKAGNISKVTIAVDENGKVTPNNSLAFFRLTLNANDGSIQENGQSTIQKLIRKGNTYNLTNIHAERTGYHDTEDNTDVSIHWSHSKTLGSNIIDEDSQIVTGTNNDDNSESLTEWTAEGNDTLYAKWTPNAYILKVYLNKPVKATEGINTHNTVSSDTNKWVYDTYTGYYKTILVYDKAWSIPESTAFAGLTGWTTIGFKNVGKTEKSDTAYLNSLNRSYDEADNVSKVSDVGSNLTSVKDDTVAYTMLWKENSYTVNFRANGGTAVKRITLLEKKIDSSVKERTVDTTASADKKATDKTYDTSITIGYESILKLQNSPVRPGFGFTFFTKDKDYAKTAHMKDDKPDFSKNVLCTGELSEEAAKKYREEYKIAGSLDGNEEVDLYSSWSKRKPVILQSFISDNSIRTDANALTKIALGTYITRDNAKDINSTWFNKNYKINNKGEYVMNDTVEVLQEWNVTKTEIKQTYSKKIMADNN